MRLQVNVDGLRLYKSSNIEFWPTLGKIFNNPDVYEPFTIAVHCGVGKPKCAEIYFEDFVKEANKLTREGFIVDGKHFKFEIMCFLCDKPARSFCKLVKGHTGYYACERCIVHGTRIGNRMTFPTLFDPKRTHESFINLENIEHHIGISPLIKLLSCNMITKFILDFMHLGWLGVQHKQLDLWTCHPQFKLSSSCISKMSRRLKNIAKQVLCEFQRTTKSMDEIPNWKATEHKFFATYSGPFILKDILPDHLYKCFLLFFVACRILHSDELCLLYVDTAEQYFIKFIQLCSSFYGPEILVYNFHALSHVCQDVRNFKCSLSRINCFSFENLLGKIRKFIRTGNEPLKQFCNRHAELEEFSVKKPQLPTVIEVLSKKRINGHGPCFVKKIKYINCILIIKNPDNIALMKNKNFIQINRIYSFNEFNCADNIFIDGEILNVNETEAFTYPTNASDLDIY